MKNIFINTILFLFVITYSFAQKGHNFGELTNAEKTFSTYKKDNEAYAVVLYERGDNYFKIVKNRIRLIKEYHVKIKILNQKGYGEGTIEIPLYHNGTSTEVLSGLKAITHNDNEKINVLPSQIFTTDLSERWRKTTFTFPNIQKGSILEYQYKVISPYFFNFKGWRFQSNIPKIHSEFNAKIPGNYVYNRDLIGTLKLSENEASVLRECFHIDGIIKNADCEVLKYTMKDIPAFKAEEDYMLSSKNYISRLVFELSEHRRIDGITDEYAKTWKDVDKEFRSDKDIGTQLTKKGFFEKQVPEQLLTQGDELTRANNIYSFIQNHYTWNGVYGIYSNNRVKKAFEKKIGNISEINISLINLLNAAGIKANLVLLSTRNNGLPKTDHPVMSDFNYVITKVEINGKNYLLDASDKFIPFGMLPYKCLNYTGRVMDFKNESYWYNIVPAVQSKKMIRGQLNFDLKEQKAFGMLDELNTGYDAVFKRKALDEKSEDDYLKEVENNASGDLTIVSYKLLEKRSDEKKVTERIEFEIENPISNDIIYFDPFLIKFFEKNPFLLEERNYPIDFGFNRNYNYSMSIEVPEGYSVDQLPEKKIEMLAENMGLLKFETTLSGNNIMVYFNLSLNRAHYLPEYYQMLKELFAEVVTIQNNSVIVFKKQL